MSQDRKPDEEQVVETAPTGHGPDEAADETMDRRERNDVVSDPARGDRVGSDWVDEGGATPDGPATTAPEEHAAD